MHSNRSLHSAIGLPVAGAFPIRMKTTGTRRIWRFSKGEFQEVEELLTVEEDFVLVVNGESILRTSCSPGNLCELAYGALFSRGIICAIDDVLSFKLEKERFSVEVRSHVPGPLSPIDSSFTLPLHLLIEAGWECHKRAVIFQQTGGTHAAVLADVSGSINFFEDVGRTCALEKVIGHALLNGISLHDKFIFLSSRVSKGMLEKIARSGIPIVGAVSAPTLQAVERAQTLGICLCGFVRDKRLNIYTNKWRVKLQ
ncbi:sufurtransferase FdhD [archaeon]|nr:MAG: sufurtransferase FdhD [archaeon]